jgi:prolyl 4-hydroxylase
MVCFKCRRDAIVASMGIMDEAAALARAGRPQDGVQLVKDRASAGDAEAGFVVANWRLWGLYGPKDAAEARRLLDESAAAGWAEAALLRATLVNNGTGGPADPAEARAILEQWRDEPAAAEQLRLLDAMPEKFEAVAEDLTDDPPVRLVRNLLSAGECDYVMRKAEPQIRPSMIIDEATGRPVPHPVRTSFGMNFAPPDEDLVIHALNRRFAEVTGTDHAAGEPLHVLRYTPGQEFRPHLDAIPGAANQRMWTAIVYLNTGFGGGETDFPELGLRTAGGKGDALIFRNALPDGAADQRARHAGLPVTSGEKWVASRWIRQRPYEPEMAGGGIYG